MQRKAGRGGADRISALPTAALHRILSFLTTREAARTSVLSRRWRRLWTTAPTLRLGVGEFLLLGTPSKPSAERRFHVAVDRVAACHNAPNLETLALTELPFPFTSTIRSDSEYSSIAFSKLISFAVARNIREVILGFGVGTDCSLSVPSSLFTCESLVALELDHSHSVLCVPTPCRLPSLKTLRLRSVVFEDDSLQRLLSSCPALEDLDLHNALFHSLHVSSPALKRLDVRSFGHYNCKFVVSAPTLRSLHYAPMLSDTACVLRNLDSVVDAVIDINRIDPPCIGTPIGDLLKGISKVRTLTLSFWSGPDEGLVGQLLLPERELRNRLPSFQNLKHLNLCIWFTKHHIEAMIYILKHAPNVESLVIDSVGPQRHRFGQSGREKESWIPQREDSKVVLHRLRSIEIKNFESSANELEFAKYLLTITQGALGKMVILPFKRPH